MEQTGGCLCGAVRYRVTGAPQSTFAVPLLFLPALDGRAVAGLGDLCRGQGRDRQRGAGRVRILAGGGARLLRALRDVADLSPREPAGPVRRDHGFARRSRELPADQGDLGRGAALLGGGQSGAAAVRAVQHVAGTHFILPAREARGEGVGALDCPRQSKIVSGGHDLAPTRRNAVEGPLALCPSTMLRMVPLPIAFGDREDVALDPLPQLVRIR